MILPQMASLTLALIGSLLVMDAAWSSSGGGRGVEYGEAEMCSNDAMGQGRRKSQVSTTYSPFLQTLQINSIYKILSRRPSD